MTESSTRYRYGMILTAFVVLLTLIGSMVPDSIWGNRDAPCVALHEATFLDKPATVRDLLKTGTNVECLDVLGQTPLVTAVDSASMGAFDVLLKAGANVNVRTQYGLSLLAQTQKKYASFNPKSGDEFRKLYQTMITRLKSAGAVK